MCTGIALDLPFKKNDSALSQHMQSVLMYRNAKVLWPLRLATWWSLYTSVWEVISTFSFVNTIYLENFSETERSNFSPYMAMMDRVGGGPDLTHAPNKIL